MTVSAAMVKAMVVKGGGMGMGGSTMTCAEICASFDPPIEFGSHKDMVGTKDGYQAEHIVPTSAFHKLGRSGPGFNQGCAGYSMPSALTWMARDGQSEAQEHKILTDQMREFSQANDLGGKNATLKEWLDEYQEGAKKALKNANPKRTVNDKSVDEESLIDAAAECIRARAAEAFAEMDPPVKPGTELRNPWAATREQQAAVARPTKRARTSVI